MIRLVGVMLVSLLGACATTEHTTTSTASARPPYSGEVQILDAMPPSGSFERVGVVIARGSDITSDQTLRRNLLQQAGQMGANAVVLQGPVRAEPSSDGQSEKKLAAWAIWRKP